jgi:hypothetical protein
MIGRAGYLGRVDLWEGTLFDDWGAGYETLLREGEEAAAAEADDAPAA